MTKLNDQHFGKGGEISPPDERDFEWKLLGASAIPFNWDLGYNIETKLPSTLSLKDQNGSSSCGGQATAYYGEVLEAIATGTQEERSAKFIYAQTHVGSGGSYLRDNCDVAVKQGWATEKVLPSYEIRERFSTETGAPLGLQLMPPGEAYMTRSEDITQEVKNDASKSKALSYAIVDHRSIDAVAQAIANNYGAIILIAGENNGTWLSPFPEVPKGKDTWRHFMYVGGAKLINGKKYIKARNSWGNVGENGWQWISEDFFTSGHILECRTIIFNDKPAQFQFKNDMYFGDRSGDVLQLQTRLVKEGYGTFEPTGYYGQLTSNAVFAFQLKNCKLSWYEKYVMKGTRVGAKTRTALNIIR